MPVHPPAPQDLPGLIEAHTQSVQAVIDLGRSCREADFEKPTACPGWTVKDQIAHVSSLEHYFATGEVPEVEVGEAPHVKNDLGRLVETLVAARRPLSGEDVVDELQEVLAIRQGWLYDADRSADEEVQGPFGPMTLEAFLRLRIFDIWVHEQDIRAALGRPGNLDTPGASIALQTLFDAFPRIVAKTAGIEPGNTVIIESTGPAVGRVGVRVEEGEDGRAVGMPLFSGDSTGVIPVIDPSAPPPPEFAKTSMHMSTDALTRRAAGRVSVEDTHYTLEGDESVGRRVLEALVITP
ncbi:maleylpyruvate isomerase family mycothiol-dependent enzyme [Actinomycetota bacterium]